MVKIVAILTNLHEILYQVANRILLAMSILDPLTCSFPKVVPFEYLTRNVIKNLNVAPTETAKGSNLKETYEELQLFFGIVYFKINYTTFGNKYPFILDQICSISKGNRDVKEHVLKTFS